MKLPKISWKKFESLTKKINLRMFKGWKPKSVLAIGRGGLVLGAIVSHKFNIPMSIILAKSYKKRKPTGQVTLSKIIGIFREPILLVDDVKDTGDTLATILINLKQRYMYDDIRVLCVVDKQRFPHPKVYSLMKAEPDPYIIFPWEEK